MGNTSGYVVTKGRAIFLLIVFIGSLIAVGLLVHFLADRPSDSPPAVAQNAQHKPVVPTSDSPITTTESIRSSTIHEAVTTTVKTPPKVKKDVRLPRSVLPRHYDVRLLPVIQVGNFSILGRVAIDIECQQDTDRIVLHSVDIAVDPETVRITRQDRNDDALMLDGIEYDTEMEFLIVKLSPKGQTNQLTKGFNYTVSMSFVGNLTDQLKGLYRSSYKENGAEKFLAVSQMEPTDARRAFPCFDEPNMKATFSVTLGRHRQMRALSNMPLISTNPIEGMQDFFWDAFEKSVPMSTYLVAFIVADFARVEATVNNAKWGFSIHARPSAANQTQYARDVGPKIQAFFEDYFQIPYPLPKQDMIAIPDFSAGAMENWGLITYRETDLLYDEKISSAANKQRVLKVISHELAHQWFGNLVTMDWWTDLWLNEGFASYVEFLGGEFAEPSFKLDQQVVTMNVQDVMTLDALESSHPISVVVNHPDEINEIFDRISYAKGCSIIRMLSNFIGEKSFRQGLTNYLTSRQYGNAVQDDLWEAFTQQSRADKVDLPATVKQIMDTWTLKMGYPVVNVTRDYKSRTVTLHQERFLMQKSNGSSEDKTVYLWWVPLTYTTDFQTVGSTWLADNQTEKSYSLDFDLGENQWLIFNINETGYFRVNYDVRNWQLITQQLMTNHTAIAVINRAQIMDDALNLANAGLLDYDIVLNLTQYLEREDEFLPWESTLSSLSYVSSMMSRSSHYGLFKKHINKIVTPVYNLLGFQEKINEPHLVTKLRVNALNWACSMGNKDCMNNAKKTYSQWMADPGNSEIISPNLKRIIACTAIREGGEEEWDFAFDRYVHSNVAGEKSVLLSSLSCSRQPWILSKLLEMSLNSTSGIRKQDAPNVVSQVAGNQLGRYLAFNFIRERWEDIRKAFTTFSSIGRVIKSLAQAFNTEIELQELMELRDVRKDDLGSAARATQQSIDTAKNNLNWMKKNYLNVVDWLERNYS